MTEIMSGAEQADEADVTGGQTAAWAAGQGDLAVTVAFGTVQRTCVLATASSRVL